MAVSQAKTTWQEALSNLVTDPEELLHLLELDSSLLASARAATRLFPLKVPRGFVERMQKGNLNDPLLKQVLPLGAELVAVEGYEQDPLQELSANPVPGLLHKYASRVLVTITSACAVHCRYCFRRYFPYTENNPGTRGWEQIMDYIQQDASINEVILSGGDPLAVSDKMLAAFVEQLTLIPHVKTLRFHTRLPVVLPERITPHFVEWLASLPFNLVMVIHANHPQEINADVQHALSLLKKTNVCLLNQSVLLKGINDNAEALIQLSTILFNSGVLPYYLHVLDKIQGAAHFDVEFIRASELHHAIAKSLPGYLVPKLVREEPGYVSKTLLT